MIAAPPVLAGAFQLTLAEPLPAVAATFVGAPGGVAAATGVTGGLAAEAGPVPALLVAFTVKV